MHVIFNLISASKGLSEFKEFELGGLDEASRTSESKKLESKCFVSKSQFYQP